MDATRSTLVSEPAPASAPARVAPRYRGRALAFVPLIRLTRCGAAILAGRLREVLGAPRIPRPSELRGARSGASAKPSASRPPSGT